MSTKNGLTVAEKNTLSACETDIERGGRLMAEAMQTIHEKKLYRNYGTFEDYCLERWKITPRHANRLLTHEKVVANLAEIGPIGSDFSERATREIANLPPEKQVEVAKKATENGKKPTAKAVKAAREEVAPKPEAKRTAVSDYFDGRSEPPADISLIRDIDKAASALSRKLASAAAVHGEGKHYTSIFKSIQSIKQACSEWGGTA